ncbi:MAG: phosphate acyltransferase PlsX [Chloroflexota bacterium]
MRIAIDAMGGDHGPPAVVAGAIEGARRFGVSVTLVGSAAELDRVLRTTNAHGVDSAVVDAPEVIMMDEHPAFAARRKAQSSMHIALDLVKQGAADAMVSAGNSGAIMAAALLVLGRIPGIERPAIASPIPTLRGRSMLLDLGAVTDPRPQHLVQFARMGVIAARASLGIEQPSVALLSNGAEPTKGNQLVQEVFPLLQQEHDLRFIGNIEGNHLFEGLADVVVTDGFSGNIALKVAEGTASLLFESLRRELTQSVPRKLAALALRPAFRSIRAKLDYRELGGAPLLGVQGVVIVAHGRSDAHAIANAIGAAKRVAEFRLVEAIAAETKRRAES